MKIKELIRSIIYERNTLSLVGNLSYAAFGFISFLLLTRTLSQEDFGSYILYVTIGVFIDLFRFGLTRTAVVRFLSGLEGEERLKVLGANVWIGSVLVIIIIVLTYLIYFLFQSQIDDGAFRYFFIYYPLLAIANLFWNNAISVLQAWQAFGRILLLRMVNIVSFVAFLVLNLFFHWGIEVIIWANIGANVLSSLLSLVKNWDGTRYIGHATKARILEIFNFGKFSVGTMIGSSLLRSADTFLLGLASFMGPVAVAKYVIPLKMTEVIEIPLRSFMATAFPKLSKAHIKEEMMEWKKIFYSYGGAIALLFIPFTLGLFIFAKPIVMLLGGANYVDSADELTLIFRVFTVYGLILPLDRISGVALDSINKPDANLWKVIFMASANIIGDLIAIYVFHSLFWVAMATILNTIVGLIMGYYYLGIHVQLSYGNFLSSGILFYKNLYQTFKSKMFK